MGLVDGRSSKEFLAHIVRDIFEPKEGVILFGGTGIEMIDVLRHPIHGIEAWGLTDVETSHPYAHQWNIPFGDSFFGLEFCNLFVALDFQPADFIASPNMIAIKVCQLLKRNALILLVNSEGHWCSSFSGVFTPRNDLVSELKSYTMLRSQNVQVLQKRV